MKRRSLPLGLALLLLGAAVSAEEPSAEKRTRTWEGYLWKDTGGRTRLGWPVVAMGVMSMPEHVVAEPDAKRFAPLVSAAPEDYTFWNYSLEKADDAAIRRLPHALVRLRGTVEGEGDPDGFGAGTAGVQTMTGARLLTVEFVSDDWLRAWSEVFRSHDSPFWYDSGETKWTVEQRKAAATKFLGILRALRKAPRASEDQQALARKIDADSRVVEPFRLQTEWQLQRWLVESNEKFRMGLEGLSDLGPLPPSVDALNRWFLESESKAAFLAKVKAAWPGDLEPIEMGYYEDYRTQYGTGTTLRNVDLKTLSEIWSDDDYTRFRASTRTIYAR